MKNLNLKIIVFGKFVTLRGGGILCFSKYFEFRIRVLFVFFKFSRFWDFVILRFKILKSSKYFEFCYFLIFLQG